MANVRIDQLTQLSNPSGSDVLPIVRKRQRPKKLRLLIYLKMQVQGMLPLLELLLTRTRIPGCTDPVPILLDLPLAE